MSRPINTCVIGLGLAGLTFHVPFILALPALFTLHSVVERNPKADGGKVQQRFGVSPKIHTSLDDALADPAIELVIIATPNHTHYPFAKAALQAGKHGTFDVIVAEFSHSFHIAVLVDKPVAETAAQARDLGALAQSKELVLYAFQNRRWDSDFLSLKSLLALPESHPSHIGSIVEFESQSVISFPVPLSDADSDS